MQNTESEAKQYPSWFSKHICKKCNNETPFSDYKRIGFYLNGENKDKLFIEYKCSNCDVTGFFHFGDEKITLETLCTLIIQQSKNFKATEKIAWKRKNLVNQNKSEKENTK